VFPFSLVRSRTMASSMWIRACSTRYATSRASSADPKEFRLVLSPDAATIVLEVVARRTAGNPGQVGVPAAGTAVVPPSKRRAIDSILRVGIYEKAITSEGEDDGHWNDAAKQVVKDVTAWMRANRVRLIP
jgi:hypothetical protein